LKRLVKFLVSGEISVKTWDDKEVAVIESKGITHGKIISVRSDYGQDNRQVVKAIFRKFSEYQGDRAEWTAHWTLQVSVKSIQNGDLICLLQGASKPCIVRPSGDCFAIVMIGAIPPEYIEGPDKFIRWSNLPLARGFMAREFTLIWNWGNLPEKMQDLEMLESLLRTNDTELEHPKSDKEKCLNKATREWNVALILGDAGEHEQAEERLRQAVEGYEVAFGVEHPRGLEFSYGLTPLSWAAENGHYDVVDWILTKDNVDPDIKEGPHSQTPLLRAADNGHEAVVKLLLKTGKVDPNMKNNDSQTPLRLAVKGAHEAVVKLLLETGKVDVDAKDEYSAQTPLLIAASWGSEAIVKLRLKTGKVEINAKDSWYSTPLLRAASGGHNSVIKLLLDTGKAEVNRKDNQGKTPLSHAASSGNEAAVKLLLEVANIEVDPMDHASWTLVFCAASKGRYNVVKLLLRTGKVDVNAEDNDGWTPLMCAEYGGHYDVAKLLR
jgi:ankyrin repeat protein